MSAINIVAADHRPGPLTASLTQQLPLSSSSSAQSGAVPVSAPPPSLDVNSLFSKLVDHGIINKKETKLEVKVPPVCKTAAAVPNLTSLDDELLRRYVRRLRRVFCGHF